jgi:hypothetical protein
MLNTMYDLTLTLGRGIHEVLLCDIRCGQEESSGTIRMSASLDLEKPTDRVIHSVTIPC